MKKRRRGRRKSAGEILLEIHEGLGVRTLDEFNVVVADADVQGDDLARLKLAYDFANRDKGFQLRAIVERWDKQTLIREMY